MKIPSQFLSPDSFGRRDETSQPPPPPTWLTEGLPEYHVEDPADRRPSSAAVELPPPQAYQPAYDPPANPYDQQDASEGYDYPQPGYEQPPYADQQYYGYDEQQQEAPYQQYTSYEQPAPPPYEQEPVQNAQPDGYLQDRLEQLLEDESPRAPRLPRQPLPGEESMDIEPHSLPPLPPEAPPPPEEGDGYGAPPPQPYYHQPSYDPNVPNEDWEDAGQEGGYAPAPPAPYPHYEVQPEDAEQPYAPPPPPMSRTRLTAPILDRFADPYEGQEHSPTIPGVTHSDIPEPQPEPVQNFHQHPVAEAPPAAEAPAQPLHGEDAYQYDTGFKQPTVADFMRQKDAGGFAAPLSVPERGPNESFHEFDEAMKAPAPAEGGVQKDPATGARLRATPLYTGTLPGTSVDKTSPVHNGTPIYIPDVTRRVEDHSAPPRRLAGLAFLFAAFVIAAAFYFRDQFYTGGVFITPLALAGCILLTGSRWTRFLGILAGFSYAAAFAVGAVALLNPDFGQSMLGPEIVLPFFAPSVPFALMGTALCILVGCFVMLLGRPKYGRVLGGMALLLLPLIGTTVLVAYEEMRPQLQAPVEDSAARRHGSRADGFFFVKPVGWARYEWTQVQERSPMGKGLTTEPKYHFVDQEKDLLAAFYIVDPHRSGLSQLLGTASVHPIEEEIARGTSSTNTEPLVREVGGRTFAENQYAGTTFHGENLNIIVDNARVRDKILFVVMIRNADSVATQETAEAAMAAFMDTFEFP